MEPLAVVAASFTLAGCVARAAVAVTEFSIDAKETSSDLANISKELQILSALIEPLSNGLSRYGNSNDVSFQHLLGQVSQTVSGCQQVVEKIERVIKKYKGHDTLWTKVKWSLFGKDQIHKLGISLESYKTALGIGLHVISM